jgi:hypothetical protein
LRFEKANKKIQWLKNKRTQVRRKEPRRRSAQTLSSDTRAHIGTNVLTRLTERARVLGDGLDRHRAVALQQGVHARSLGNVGGVLRLLGNLGHAIGSVDRIGGGRGRRGGHSEAETMWKSENNKCAHREKNRTKTDVLEMQDST